MKLYLMTDLEGVAGVASHAEQSYPDGKYFEQAKLLLTAEVNAAIEGALSAGVEDVLVADGHGPGAIVFEELHPSARLLHGRPITLRQLYEPMWDADAVGMIGQHARAGVGRGNQSHSYNSRSIDWMHLNQKPVGEIAVAALWAGLHSVPLIFLSGDEAACEEAQHEVPGIHTAAVKAGVAKNVAISCSCAESQKRIREGIAGAVEAHRTTPISPVSWPAPFTLSIRYFLTSEADRAHARGAERLDDQTVQYQDEKFDRLIAQALS